MTKHKALMGGFFGKFYKKKKIKGGYSLLILKLVMNGLRFPKCIPLNSICLAFAMCQRHVGRAATTRVRNSKKKKKLWPQMCIF